MLGIADADHEETALQGKSLVVSRLACSLAGRTETVRLVAGTRAGRAYGRGEVVEQYRCSYGLNPGFRDRIVKGGLVVSGVGEGGEARIVELPGHRFYVATLFLPQLASAPDAPHPLVMAYLRAAVGG